MITRSCGLALFDGEKRVPRLSGALSRRPAAQMPTMRQILIPGLACLASLLPTSAVKNAPQPDEAPNIIFVLADDPGYGDVGAFGQQIISTPRLDAMAAEGMRLTRHYASSTVCAPSRATPFVGTEVMRAS